MPISRTLSAKAVQPSRKTHSPASLQEAEEANKQGTKAQRVQLEATGNNRPGNATLRAKSRPNLSHLPTSGPRSWTSSFALWTDGCCLSHHSFVNGSSFTLTWWEHEVLYSYPGRRRVSSREPRARTHGWSRGFGVVPLEREAVIVLHEWEKST